MRWVIPALLLMLVLSACASGLEEAPPAAPLQTPQTPVYLDVAEIFVVSDVEASGELTFIDRRRGAELANALADALQSGLVVSGPRGRAEALIDEAALLERDRPASRGRVVGALVGDPRRQLSARAVISLTISDTGRGAPTTTVIEIEGDRALPGGTSSLGKDAQAQALIADMTGELERALARAAREDLAPYLAPSAPSSSAPVDFEPSVSRALPVARISLASPRISLASPPAPIRPSTE